MTCSDPDASQDQRYTVREVVRQRVRMVPVTEFAIRFHGDAAPRTYAGRPVAGGPASPPTPEGFLDDGFARDNYLAWVEERIEFELDVTDPHHWTTEISVTDRRHPA